MKNETQNRALEIPHIVRCGAGRLCRGENLKRSFFSGKEGEYGNE